MDKKLSFSTVQSVDIVPQKVSLGYGPCQGEVVSFEFKEYVEKLEAMNEHLNELNKKADEFIREIYRSMEDKTAYVKYLEECISELKLCLQ